MFDKIKAKIKPVKAKFNTLKDEFNAKFSHFKHNTKMKFNKNKEKFIRFVNQNLSDILVFIALIIIGINTIDIQVNAGFYVIALECLFVAFKARK